MYTRIVTVVVLFAALSSSFARGEDAKPLPDEQAKVLERFVGVWTSESNSRPAKFRPEAMKLTVAEQTDWILKHHFILGREVSEKTGKFLWVMGYDNEAKCYQFWGFNNHGLYGGRWSSTWDENTKTLTGHASDTPAGWTSQGLNKFPDADTNQTSAWMKDADGTLCLDIDGLKKRKPASDGGKVLEAWSKAENLPEKSAENKILDRIVGDWDGVSTFKVAEWTPKEVKLTSKLTRSWTLDGNVVEERSQISDGSESYSLSAYDPQAKFYKHWWFNSEGNNNKTTGQWDAASESISYQGEVPGGFNLRSKVKFQDKDHQVWNVSVTDWAGKSMFEGQWDLTRQKK